MGLAINKIVAYDKN